MNFEDIYKAYWDKVFRLCMGYFNDYPLAQDLAQDVFARVWQYLPSFKGESSVGSWIFRIATNICLRQGERQRRISQTEVPPDVSVEAADDRSLHVQALYKAISGLSETDRLIISLYLVNSIGERISGKLLTSYPFLRDRRGLLLILSPRYSRTSLLK